MLKRLLPLFALFCLLYQGAIAQEDRELRIERLENNPYQDPTTEFIRLKEQLKNELTQKDKLQAGTTLQKMGNMCYRLGHFDQAFEYYLQARKIFETANAYKKLAGLANEIGILYYYNKDLKAAKAQYARALDLFTQQKDQQGMAETYGRIGHLFEKQHQYDSAALYQRTALQTYLRINDDQGTAKIYENLGSINEDLEKYDSAGYYFKQADQLYKKAGVDPDRIEVLNNIGDIYRKTGNYREGLAYSFLAAELARKYGEHYQLCSAYRDIGKGYNLMGINDSAFYYLELSRKNLLDIYSEESNKQIAFLQVQYEINKKNQEINRLQVEKRINIIIGICVIVVILLLIVAGIAIISRQKLKNRNEQIQHENERHVLETQNKLNEAELKARTLEEEKLKTELKNRQLEKEKLSAELKSRHLEEETLKLEIETKAKELSTHTLHIIQKNHLLENMKGRLELMVKDEKRDQKKQLRELIQQIAQSFNNDKYWEEFSNTFEQIHSSFFRNLKQHATDFTASEMRLISLLKMNLSSGDIATILGISQDSLRVARYRLRKKLNLEQGENLTAFFQSMS